MLIFAYKHQKAIDNFTGDRQNDLRQFEQPCKLDEDFKTCQAADMAHMSRQTVCSLPTGSSPRESGPRWQKTPAHCLQQWARVSGAAKNVKKAPIIQGKWTENPREILKKSQKNVQTIYITMCVQTVKQAETTLLESEKSKAKSSDWNNSLWLDVHSYPLTLSPVQSTNRKWFQQKDVLMD